MKSEKVIVIRNYIIFIVSILILFTTCETQKDDPKPTDYKTSFYAGTSTYSNSSITFSVNNHFGSPASFYLGDSLIRNVRVSYTDRDKNPIEINATNGIVIINVGNLYPEYSMTVTLKIPILPNETKDYDLIIDDNGKRTIIKTITIQKAFPLEITSIEPKVITNFGNLTISISGKNLNSIDSIWFKNIYGDLKSQGTYSQGFTKVSDNLILFKTSFNSFSALHKKFLAFETPLGVVVSTDTITKTFEYTSILPANLLVQEGQRMDMQSYFPFQSQYSNLKLGDSLVSINYAGFAGTIFTPCIGVGTHDLNAFFNNDGTTYKINQAGGTNVKVTIVANKHNFKVDTGIAYTKVKVILNLDKVGNNFYTRNNLILKLNEFSILPDAASLVYTESENVLKAEFKIDETVFASLKDKDIVPKLHMFVRHKDGYKFEIKASDPSQVVRIR